MNDTENAFNFFIILKKSASKNEFINTKSFSKMTFLVGKSVSSNLEVRNSFSLT